MNWCGQILHLRHWTRGRSEVWYNIGEFQIEKIIEKI